MKKASALFLTVLILLISLMPVASAVVVSFDNGLEFNPGNTRWLAPDYNYAWLDQLFVRDDSDSVTLKELTPKPTDYPYGVRYEDFLEECNRYIDLYNVSAESVGDTYMKSVEALYYLAVSMGFTANVDFMGQVLIRNGIDVPDNPTAEDKMAIGVVYAAIDYNSVYIFTGEELELPYGISLEEALVIILAKITGVEIDEDVNTLSGLGAEAVKSYLEEYEGRTVPLSKNPSDEELFYWLKATVASNNGYSVPTDKYNQITKDEAEYVDYVYFSSVLESAYEVRIDPEKLIYAHQDKDPYAVHSLVLKTMLDEKGVAYGEKDSTEKLFNLACKAGYFALEKEFFSDVLRYELEVAPSCEKVWFTPITLGDQLNGGDKTPLTLFLQGTEIAPGSTNAAILDKTKSEETVRLEVVYNDGLTQESAVYEFRVIKNPELEKASSGSSTDLVGQVQNFVDSVVPDGEKADEVMSDVFSAIGNVSAQSPDAFAEDILSTYSTYVESAGEGVTGEYDFDYLGQLISDVYETDVNGNIITTKVYTTAEDTSDEEGNVIQKVTQAVAENPQIVAAPTGLIALGGLVGFMMNKKHREVDLFAEEESEKE